MFSTWILLTFAAVTFYTCHIFALFRTARNISQIDLYYNAIIPAFDSFRQTFKLNPYKRENKTTIDLV